MLWNSHMCQLVSLFCDFVTHCNFVNVSAGTEVEKNKMGSQTSLISNTSEFSQRTLFGLWWQLTCHYFFFAPECGSWIVMPGCLLLSCRSFHYHTSRLFSFVWNWHMILYCLHYLCLHRFTIQLINFTWSGLRIIGSYRARKCKILSM